MQLYTTAKPLESKHDTSFLDFTLFFSLPWFDAFDF